MRLVGDFAPHAEAAVIDYESASERSTHIEISPLVDKVYRRINSVDVSPEVFLPEELKTSFGNWLLEIKRENEHKEEPLPIAIIGYGSFFNNQAAKVLKENKLSSPLEVMSELDFDPSDIDLFFPKPVSLHSIESNDVGAANVGRDGIISVSKYNIFQDMTHGHNLDANILGWKHREFKSTKEMIAAYSLLSPNDPCVLFELDNKDKLVARIVWDDQAETSLEPYDVKINGTRAVSLAIQRTHAQLESNPRLSREEIDFFQSQNYKTIIPKMFKNISPIAIASVWNRNDNSKLLNRHHRTVVDQGYTGRIQLYSLVVAKEFKRAMEEYEGTEMNLVMSLIESGLLQTTLQAVRLTSNEGYEILEPIIDLFTEACLQGIEANDPEMKFLIKNIAPALRSFTHFSRVDGLHKSEHSGGKSIDNYDLYARFAMVLENIPQDIFERSYSGKNIKIERYDPNTPLGFILNGHVPEKRETLEQIEDRINRRFKINKYIQTIAGLQLQ